MASTPAPHKDEEVNNPPTSASYFQKTVCLQDWWLIKAEKDFQGKSIAVAGTSREKFAVRMFSSAPILKTYDLQILETVDGVSVILKGFINKERTKENGFSSEVFKHFVFGFPADWERHAEGCFVGGSSIKHTSKMVEGSSIDDSTDSSLASDKLSTDSGKSLSFKRSRSGRLLVPTLEFWRNQRVVYDVEHKVTAFVEGDWERTSSKVTRSEPRRKRGRL